MATTLFDDQENSSLDQPKSSNVVLSNTESNKSKARISFQKVLDKNYQLKQKMKLAEDLARWGFSKAQELLADPEKQYGENLLAQLLQLEAAYSNRLFKFTQRRKEAFLEFILKAAMAIYREFELDESKMLIERLRPGLFSCLFDESDEPADHIEFDPSNDPFEEFRHEDESEEMSFRSSRKKTKKQLEREERKKADEKLLEMDIQELFKQLALKLHPDKERSEAVKLENEELFKLVNKARDESDVYELLRIRMLVSEHDPNFQTHIINEETVIRLTTLVKQKNKALERSIDGLFEENPVLDFVDLRETRDIGELKILDWIRVKKEWMEEDIQSRKSDLNEATKNNKSLNQFIDSIMGYMAFDDLMDSLFNYDEDEFDY